MKGYFLIITVIFSLVFASRAIAQTKTPSPTPSPAPTEDITEKVKDKIEMARKNPKAVIGTVTDKGENSIQTKTTEGEIEQISVKADTSYVMIGKTVSKIKYEDLALGDFIAALGYKTNKVLESSRILVTTQPAKVKRIPQLVDVISKTKTSTTVKDNKGKEITLNISNQTLTFEKVDKNITKSRFANVANGDKLVVVGTFTDSEVDASLIYIVNAEVSPTPSPTSTPTTKQQTPTSKPTVTP